MDAFSTSEDLEDAVVEVWRDSRRTSRTITHYLQWVRRFLAYCTARQLDPCAELTREGARTFGAAYRGPRRRGPASRGVRANARCALRAWACALRVLGRSTPDWMPPRKEVALPPLLAEYSDFRRVHRGVSPGSIHRDIVTAVAFLDHLRARGRSLRTARPFDIDAYVLKLSRTLSRHTTADTCSVLRSFLRFLQTTGRLQRDLASAVVAPRIRPMDRPPRALAWPEVQRLLSGVKHDRRGGYRDFGILLLMASYGLGGAEIVSLRLEDVEWKAQTLRICRPKTGVPVILPLLPAVARALAQYLRQERPQRTTSRALFVTNGLPHRGISSGAIRHLIRKHAETAGITLRPLGAHLLRHSFACRQVEIGAPPKVLSDILGHRRPSSTSVYVRVAIERLRQVGLPVPR
jgi:integrase/recombinase XerD